MYGECEGMILFENVKATLYELFDDYNTASQDSSASTELCGGSQSVIASTVVQVNPSTKSTALLKARFKQQKIESGIGGSKKQSELDIYLSESALEESEDGKFDLLRWWKLNAERFPVLSCLAYDILAIPVSTVASE